MKAMADPVTEMAAWNAAFCDAIKRGDAARLVSLYADEAMLLPPGKEALSGRDAILAFWQEFLTIKVLDATLEADTVEFLGDALQVTGRGSLKLLRPGNTEPEAVYYKYLTIYKLEESAWKATADMWNFRPPF